MNFHRLDRPWSLFDRIIVRAIIFGFLLWPWWCLILIAVLGTEW